MNTQSRPGARPIAAAFAALVLSVPSRADRFVVNTFEDGNDGSCAGPTCTLREAVILCTGTPGPDVIELDDGVYHLTLPGNADNSSFSGDLDVNFGEVTIEGAGMGLTIIDANDLDRIFDVAPLQAATTLILRDLTVRNGLQPGPFGLAGGILVGPVGTLMMERVEITGCQANDDGGGLTIVGNAQVVDSIISNNAVTAGFGNGGGVFVSFASSLPVVFERTRIINNTAPNGGPAIFMADVVHLIDCTITNNNGPAANTILMNDPFNPTLVAVHTTFNGNNGGVALVNGAGTSIQMTNCTLSGNTVAPALRAGLGGGTISLTNCTITGNSAGGLQRFGGTINVKNTLIAGNSAFQVNGTITSQGHNLFGGTGGAVIVGDGAGNIVNANAMLGPLADNGGDTLTHELLAGSPAIDAANPADFPSADQRGVLRPLDGDANGSLLPDIGAFEVKPPPPGDLDGNGEVDGADLGSLLLAWGTCPRGPACPADLTGDGIIDGADLGILLLNWS
jgi:CSLREA domain-containing protein